LYWQSADGTAPAQHLFTAATETSVVIPESWSHDAALLLFTVVNLRGGGRIDVSVLDVAKGQGVEKKLLSTRSREISPVVAPDGNWIAYTSDESGREEVYVQPFPDLGSRQRVSSDGGNSARWSQDGRVLFYLTLDGRQLMQVPIVPGAPFSAGQPTIFRQGNYVVASAGPIHPYDVAKDGRVVIMQEGEIPEGFIVVQEWFEELKRLVPTK
jgi:Tol biopolymer transport system component